MYVCVCLSVCLSVCMGVSTPVWVSFAVSLGQKAMQAFVFFFACLCVFTETGRLCTTKNSERQASDRVEVEQAFRAVPYTGDGGVFETAKLASIFSTFLNDVWGQRTHETGSACRTP